MALRLSEPAPTTGPALQTAALPARAVTLLAGRDVAAYRALFAQAAEEPDVHRRYAARIALVEAGLAAPRGSLAETAQVLLAVADESLTVLEEEPREPLLLNFAGVSLYELGALAGAERLFQAAGRLDPDLPHVRRNLKEIAARRKVNAPPPRLPAAVTTALRPLEQRARRVASQARPAEGLTLSLCMIVRDEESMLGRCLEAARDAVDEIVVVDTGSTDRTVEIAREHGARVLEREWTGSFSDARNASFEAATGDWIVYLDADEVLEEGQAERLRALTGRTWREAFYLVEVNHTGHMEAGTAVTHNALRVFRNRAEYRFDGRIHEQIANKLPNIPERLEWTDIRVEHYGYLGVVRDAKRKSERNLELLERQVQEGNDTPFLHFNLGSEHSALGDHARALEHFRRAWTAMRAEPDVRTYGYTPSLAARYALTLRVNGHREELDRHVEDALTVFPGFTDLVFEQAIAAKLDGDGDRAGELLERCLEMGDAPSGYSATMGCGTHLALCLLGDVHRERGDLAGAERLLRRSLAEHPRFLAAVEPLAEVLLAAGREPADVAASVLEVAEDTPSARFLLAVPLYESGAVEAAEVQLRAVLERQPHAAPPRVALAEALLSQRRWAEAAEVAREVPSEAPVATAAARAELFARVVSAEGADRIAGALERAREAGAGTDDLALFKAWSALVFSGERPDPLPPGSAELLFASMEALLRVQEIDPFVAALPLVEALPLARRQRRERMAQMYVRRGFVESAADEWAAAVQEDGVDADALAGLATAALGAGNIDDAKLFAQGAQELHPGHPQAVRVLARLGE